MQKCPKCSYERQPEDDKMFLSTECPKCGVIYEKAQKNEALSDNIAQPIHLRRKKQERSKIGLRSFFTAGKKMEEIKMALIGKYVFDNLKDEELKEQIVTLGNYRFEEGMHFHPTYKEKLDKYGDKVRYLFLALAMGELGVSHGLNGFRWTYVRNPLRVGRYDEGLWEATRELVQERWGINASL